MWAPCLVKYISLCTFQVEDILLATESRVCEIIGDALQAYESKFFTEILILRQNHK